MRADLADSRGNIQRRQNSVRPDIADQPAPAPEARPRSEAFTPQRLA